MESSICIFYRYRAEPKTIELKSALAVAQFLKKHGMIKFFSIRNDEVKMFTKQLETYGGLNGEPRQQEHLEILPWEDIDFTPGQIITFAVAHKCETNKELKKLFMQIFKAA